MSKEVPLDSLSTLDELGGRRHIHPAPVQGKWKKYKNWVHPILILIFLCLPWVTHNGHQLILLDVPKRQFNFFGVQFFAHDTPIIFFILSGLLVGLSFVTAIWGRIWCGWACPQTVFIESLFRRVEEFIEGPYIKRRKMAEKGRDFNQQIRNLVKWFVFLFLSLIITHSFLAYFVGANELKEMVFRPPSENWASFVIIVITTAIILFDFGWFREQFCLIMCPYGRFQSVLLDRNSLSIFYDGGRGEPRKGTEEGNGDCINCYRCVNVCPTGIDIRNGLQMECIACTACIDACDEVMEKVNKPKGLIRYSSINQLSKNPEVRKFSYRTVVYAAILLVLFSGFVFVLSDRTELSTKAIRAIEAPYKMIEEGGNKIVVNHFRLVLKNQNLSELNVSYSTGDENVQLIAPENPVNLKPGESKRVHLFVKKALDKFNNGDKSNITLDIRYKGKRLDKQKQMDLLLLSPSQ